MVKRKEVTMSKEYELGSMVSNAFVKGLSKMDFVADGPENTILGTPRKRDGIDKQW